MNNRYFYLLPFVFCLLLLTGTNAAQKVFPPPTGYVNDFAGVIDAESKTRLTRIIEVINQKTTAEIAVVTIGSMEELGFAAIEETAVKLFEEWGVGKKGKDNGILIIAAIKERKVRIEVGYGMEGEIPDGAAGEIIRTGIVPYFKKQRFGDGLYNGALLIAERIKVDVGEKGKRTDSKGFTNDDIINIIILSLILLGIVAAGIVNSRRRGYYNDGGGFWGYGGGGFGGGFGSFGGSGGSSDFGGFGGGGSGGGSDSDGDEAIDILTAPTGVQINKRRAKTVTVAWNAVTSAASYEVGIFNHKSGKKLKTVAASNSKRLVKKLTSNKKYNFKVRSVGESGTRSGWSVVTAGRTLPAAPKALKVGGVSITGSVEASATLRWNKPRGTVNKYVVTVYNADGSVYDTLTTAKRSLTVERLSRGTSYSFSVKARFNKKNSSAASKRKSFNTPNGL